MQFNQLKRRHFITLLGGAATWSLAAHAQPSARRPTLGLLIPGSPDSYGQRVSALVRRCAIWAGSTAAPSKSNFEPLCNACCGSM